ncbi:MAG TPA: Xaa-Pro peptidase family protein [Thermoanaerobaculia bacterium]
MRRFVVIALLLFPLFASADYRARRERLAARLDANTSVALVFGSEEEDDSFRQNDDFYYLTGWNEPGAALLIAPAREGRPYEEILFLPDRNVSLEQWTGGRVTASSTDARGKTGFDRVLPLDALRDELVRVLPPRPTIHTQPEDASVPLRWLRRANAFPRYTTYESVATPIGALRLIKDGDEIALIRKAVNATVSAHNAASRALRAGATENEIAGLIEYEFRRAGCEGRAFPSIVGSGRNSTVLHYNENSGTLAAGDVVVIDIGAECSRYAADVTRTYPVGGRFTPRQREIYDIVLAAQQAAVDAFKSGVSTIGRASENSLYKVAYEYINTHGKDQKGQPLGQYFIHGLSHYVGLAVHDAGSTSAPLLPGAVFTIEPGIYIPEERIGVRIEDTYRVREDGTLECMSCAAPK